MTVHCPHCLTGYLIPDELLGAGGARVRCPGCDGVFAVLPGGGATGEPGAAPEAAPDEAPARVAGAVLDVLADFLGEALTRSRDRGTVLSDHGPAIIAVWEEYRRRAGADAPSAVFRATLRERCGVDLSSTSGS